MRKQWWLLVFVIVTGIVLSVILRTNRFCELKKWDDFRPPRVADDHAGSGSAPLGGAVDQEEPTVEDKQREAEQKRENEAIGRIGEANSRGDLSLAITLAKDYLSKHPNTPTVRILLAEAYSQDNKYFSAEEELNKVLSASPGNVWALRVLAVCYLKEGKAAVNKDLRNKYLSAAKEKVDRALSLASNDPHVCFAAAQVLLTLDKKQLALEYVNKALSHDPGNTGFADFKRNLKKSL